MKFEFKTQPFAHQQKALDLSAMKKNFAYFMEMGCVDGETEFLTNRGWMKFKDFDINKIERPFLGISMIDSGDTTNLNRYNISIDGSIEGAVVIQTQEGSPAYEAKLEKGDIITKIEDYEVTSVAKLKYYLYKYKPGDKVKITYVRGTKTETVTIKLAKSE
jgi:S1-C subfamily serine protease